MNIFERILTAVRIKIADIFGRKSTKYNSENRMKNFTDWCNGPASLVHTIMVPMQTMTNVHSPANDLEEFMEWCRDNCRGRVHVPMATSGLSSINSDNLHRPKDDFKTPYRWNGYNIRRQVFDRTTKSVVSLGTDHYTLVLCEEKNDVMKIKLAWC